MERGGPVILLRAASSGIAALLLFHFLGLFPGVYLLAAATLLFLLGGWQQAKQKVPVPGKTA